MSKKILMNFNFLFWEIRTYLSSYLVLNSWRVFLSIRLNSLAISTNCVEANWVQSSVFKSNWIFDTNEEIDSFDWLVIVVGMNCNVCWTGDLIASNHNEYRINF